MLHSIACQGLTVSSLRWIKLDVKVLISVYALQARQRVRSHVPRPKIMMCNMHHVFSGFAPLHRYRLSLRCSALRSLLITSCILSVAPTAAQVSFDQPPIDYFNASPSDSVVRLQAKIDADELQLEFEPRRGYLKSLLQHLNVRASSQTLVFSKTSFQLRRISPHTPRALYFNDEVYIGWVKQGDVMEISAVDPNLGANFYTLQQRESGSTKVQASHPRVFTMPRFNAFARRPRALGAVCLRRLRWSSNSFGRYVSDGSQQPVQPTLGWLVCYRQARNATAHGQPVGAKVGNPRGRQHGCRREQGVAEQVL